MPDIKLIEIKSISEFMALGAVRVQPEQRRFAKNPILTLLQSRHPAVTSYRIELDANIIGYVMLIHAENPTQWIIERLTIDRDHQRQGHGCAVADQLIDMIHGFENSEMVIARYAPENEAACNLFTKLGFVQREEMFRGRHVAILEFEFEEIEIEDQDEDAEYEADEGADEEDVGDDDDADEEDVDDNENDDEKDWLPDYLKHKNDSE